MNLRFRLLIILFGAALVAAAFTFPEWFPRTLDPSEIVLFPELPESLQADFDALPPEQRDAYLALREQNVRQAALMAAYALQGPVPAPEDEQENPNRSGQIAIRDGEFVTISPIRSAEGKVTLYELPDGTRYLWLEDFSVIPARGLRLFLSSLTTTRFTELIDDKESGDFTLSLDDLLLDPLRFNVGNQAYQVPREADLSRYNAVLIYSTDLELLYSYAEW